MQPTTLAAANSDTTTFFESTLEQQRANALECFLNGNDLNTCIRKICASLESETGAWAVVTANFEHKSSTFDSDPYANPQHQAICGPLLADLVHSHTIPLFKLIQEHKPIVLNNVESSLLDPAVKKVLAEFTIQALWVLPIESQHHQLSGALIFLFNQRNPDNLVEQEALKRSVNSVSAMQHFSDKEQQKALVRAEQDVKQSKELYEYQNLKVGLEKALSQRDLIQEQLLELEKIAVLETMMSSFTHEINTPIGVSLTASSFLNELQRECLQKLEENKLKRSELLTYLQECKEASHIIQRNVQRADELIATFKQLSVDQDSQGIRTFDLCEYVHELLLSLKPKLRQSNHNVCLAIPSGLLVTSKPGAIGQILTNFITNSIIHGFENMPKGRITIGARLLDSGQKLAITYQDNGKGMNEHVMKNIYRPFFSGTNNPESTGLGLHICSNLVIKVLRGSISCDSKEGKGTSFNIELDNLSPKLP
jgi:signal transduction histidine kinase